MAYFGSLESRTNFGSRLLPFCLFVGDYRDIIGVMSSLSCCEIVTYLPSHRGR